MQQRFFTFLTAVALLVPSKIVAFSPNLVSVSFSKREDTASTSSNTSLSARSDLTRRKALRSLPLLPLLLISSFPASSLAKCTDIESCREAGERKMEQDAIDNPITKLPFGVKYKVLQPGTGDRIVAENDNIDLIFSVSRLGGGYMYSRGFGFEKIDGGNGKMISDAGLDSIRVQLGTRDVPIGIQEALVGMKKGERRRVELPPNVGFVTSNWQPEPTTKRGQATLAGYKRVLEGNGTNQPPFPALSIWDVEVLRIRK